MITDTLKTWHITILRWDGAQSVAQIFVVNVENYILDLSAIRLWMRERCPIIA